MTRRGDAKRAAEVKAFKRGKAAPARAAEAAAQQARQPKPRSLAAQRAAHLRGRR